ALNLPYGVHVAVKAGFGTDGLSTFKVNMPDGYYTLIYPKQYEPGLCGIEYRVYGTILRQEISKSNCNENYEIMKLQDEKSIPNARPIMNNFRTTFVRTQR
nr:DNA polymerase III subunit alpha [Fervidobacterium sp.]